MTIRTTFIASSLIAASLISGTAHAVLQGRDLNGSAGSFEAYYDTDLDITWLANANYGAGSIYDDGNNTIDGRMTWGGATTWAANLSFYNPLTNQTYSDWRLPTSDPTCGDAYNCIGSEMGHLFYSELGGTAYQTILPLQPSAYWSATEYSPGSPWVYYFDFGIGFQWFDYKVQSPFDAGYYALAVSPGDVAAVPEAQTYALMLAGLGLIGWRARRRG